VSDRNGVSDRIEESAADARVLLAPGRARAAAVVVAAAVGGDAKNSRSPTICRMS
jgi:hypothetical protein